MDWINLDSIMASLDIRALEVIQKPPEERSKKDTDLLVPWLKKKTRVVQTLETETVAQIVKYCEYLRAEKDQVIIEQGERGDTLYIILSGTVSVYINAAKIAEDGTPLAETRVQADLSATDQGSAPPGANDGVAISHQKAAPDGGREQPPEAEQREDAEKTSTKPAADSDSVSVDDAQRSCPGDETESSYSGTTDTQKKALKTREKNKYGKFIDKIEAGKCFGEIALISEKNIRNATIISDGPTDLMVIRKELYDRTLKDYQKREFAERRQFVRRHPLFKNWAKHIQRLLEMSLVREMYTFGSHIVRQGEPWNGLTFIQRGRARLLVEPSRHKRQYKDFAPFPTKNDIYAIEFNKPQKKPPEHPEEILRLDHIQVRRTEGYAAAERRHLHREIPLCIVEEGEIIGDLEYVFNLRTHSASVVCMAPTEVFVLTAKNIDRLINKKTPSTAGVLKMEVETKLRNRLGTKQGSEVFLYRHLLFKLTEEIPISQLKQPDFGVGANAKSLPDKETLFLHLMRAFAENRAAAVIPYTEGAVFLREKMRQKARLREIVRKRQGENAPGTNGRQRRVRRPPSPKPRSIQHLKMALKKQEEGVEASEREYLAKEYRNLEQEVMKEFYRSALGGLSQSGDVEQGLQVICDRLAKASQSFRAPPLPGIRVSQSLPDLSRSKVVDLEPPHSQREAVDETFITRLNQPEVAGPPDAGSRQDGGGVKVVAFETDVGNTTAAAVDAPAHDVEPETAEAGQRTDVDDTDVPHIRVSTPESVVVTPPLNAASELVVAKEAVHMTSRSEESGAEGEDDFIPEEAKWRLEQLEASIKNSVKLAPEDPSYRDWETSDKSLQYLEERVKNFKINREPTFVRLPPLSRFQAGDSEAQPRPGARVLIQRKRCIAVTKAKSVSNHNHVSHHVVPTIENYDKLKYHKILSHFALDDVREKWLEKHRKKQQQKRQLGVQTDRSGPI